MTPHFHFALTDRQLMNCLGYCLASVILASPLLAQAPTADDIYLGTWCGADAEAKWKRTVEPDGTYSQFNVFFPEAEYYTEPHWEFGSWSITDNTITTRTEQIQYIGQEPQIIDQPFSFDALIHQLTPDTMTVEYADFGLFYTSTRDCPAD